MTLVKLSPGDGTRWNIIRSPKLHLIHPSESITVAADVGTIMKTEFVKLLGIFCLPTTAATVEGGVC